MSKGEQLLALENQEPIQAEAGQPQSLEASGSAPMGRIGAQIAVLSDKTLILYGGACERGEAKECTLDDLWAMPLTESTSGETLRWRCLLPPSPKTFRWDSTNYESESESQLEEEDSEEEGDDNAQEEDMAT